ncbi:MAG: ribosome assembly cofactor RimP [Alistipes sp.]
MIETQKIVESATRQLEQTDLFVVGCTCTPGNEIELTIDSDTSVEIDACATLSRFLEEQLDRDEEDFSLTVASAGIGSELRCLRQYRKLIGSSVEVLLTSGVKVLAKLDQVDEEGITLCYEEKQAVAASKRKQLVTVTRRYPFTEIKYTKEYLDFK